MMKPAEEVIDAHGGLDRWGANRGGEPEAVPKDSPSAPKATPGSLDQIAEVTGGALRTYISAPLLPFLDRVTGEEPYPRWRQKTRVLRPTLPAGLESTDPNHTLIIDEHRMIQRHHYVATAFGRCALASSPSRTTNPSPACSSEPDDA